MRVAANRTAETIVTLYAIGHHHHHVNRPPLFKLLLIPPPPHPYFEFCTSYFNLNLSTPCLNLFLYSITMFSGLCFELSYIVDLGFEPSYGAGAPMVRPVL